MRVTFNPDKFGYYTVGDFKTYSKFEAIELQKKTGLFPDWHFNRTAFSSVDWTKEPDIDLWELYKARARQIRENYDYVVLWYSGGGDSNNVVSSFLAADCKIDEIATFWYYQATGDINDHMNAEPYTVVLEKMKNFKKTNNVNFRLIDVSENVIEETLKQDLVYMVNNRFSLHTVGRLNLRQKVKEYDDLISQGKKIAFVWGLDKPQVFYDGRHYVQFFDFFDNFVSPYHQRTYDQGMYDEMFYWTPDLPELMVKQAHIIKRFLETVNDPAHYRVKSGPFGYNPKIKRYLKSDTFKTLLYPTWDTSTFQNGKSPGKIYSIKDEWFWNSDLDAARKVRSQIEYYIDQIGPEWLNDPTDIQKGVKCHASPKYYL